MRPIYTVKLTNGSQIRLRLEELFDHVSPQAYEAFEHARFKDEAVEQDRANQARAASRRGPGRPRKEVARPDAFSEDDSSTSEASSIGQLVQALPIAEEKPVATGRAGRPRPSYTHLYKPRRARRSRNADDDCGHRKSTGKSSAQA